MAQIAPRHPDRSPKFDPEISIQLDALIAALERPGLSLAELVELRRRKAALEALAGVPGFEGYRGASFSPPLEAAQL